MQTLTENEWNEIQETKERLLDALGRMRTIPSKLVQLGRRAKDLRGSMQSPQSLEAIPQILQDVLGIMMDIDMKIDDLARGMRFHIEGDNDEIPD